VILAFIVTLIGNVGILEAQSDKIVKDIFDKKLKPVNDKIDNLTKQVNRVDLNTCKNYLVHFLSDVQQNKPIDEVEFQRFWEQYEHYVNNGGNSYIHKKVEHLEHENKL
jgi:hypothetical protein